MVYRDIPGLALSGRVSPAYTSHNPLVAGFVGQAQRGPVNHPLRLTDWVQYGQYFGGFQGCGFLPYAVRGFFENGGRACHVLRVAHASARAAHADFEMQGEAGPARFAVTAIDPGEWGNAVSVRLFQQSENDMEIARLLEPVVPGGRVAVLNQATGWACPPGNSRHGLRIGLVHPSRPLRLENLAVAAIDGNGRELHFQQPLAHGFPAGTRVLSRGMRLEVTHRCATGPRQEVFDPLSPHTDHARYLCSVINGEAAEGGSAIMRVHDRRGSRENAILAEQRGQAAHLRGGRNGKADLTPELYLGSRGGQPFLPMTQATPASAACGLARLGQIEEIAVVAVPDLAAGTSGRTDENQSWPGSSLAGYENQAQARNAVAQVLRHCHQQGDRFALIDVPHALAKTGQPEAVAHWARGFEVLAEATNGVCYFPWVEVPAPHSARGTAAVPPSGHLAGLIARAQHLAQKGPANLPLHGISALTTALNDESQGLLNPRGVNGLRHFPARGFLAWGARTMSRQPRWRYLAVRHTYLTLVRQIRIRLRPLVFEPNERGLRNRISAALADLGKELYQRGRLAGQRFEEAFFVACNTATNHGAPPGAVIAHLGFAPSYPAEFIHLEVIRHASGIAVSPR